MLDGFRISGYRSFGADPIDIPDLQRVNVFIGKNNCGKSNILRFIHLLSAFSRPQRHNEVPPRLDPMLDYALGTPSRSITYGLQIKKNGFTNDIFQKISEPFGSSWQTIFPTSPDEIWLDFHLDGNGKPVEHGITSIANNVVRYLSSGRQQELTRVLCHYTGGGDEQRGRDIALALHALAKPTIDVHIVDAFRKISEAGGDRMTGSGLIKELRKLQSPQLADYAIGKARFATIVGFLQSILGEPKASLEIPADKDEIYVTLNDRVLPLESLGTGIHELIIMASAVTLVNRVIFCIEEPEIHLHPELQKKFIAYISNKTNNQYLIASHSNSFFDLPGVNIYSCNLREGHTYCSLVSAAQDKHDLLRSMGYRPSDLLQTNYVIWVEGPSDRLYINHWIHAKAPDLVEGLHYSIMFYGGRLLSHLSYDDNDVADFVKLARLNRSACIVFDSDKDGAHSRINNTKRRVKDEFERNSCAAWVTNGRTVENYIPESLFNDAVLSVHPKTYKKITWSRFGDLTRLRNDKVIDKVAVARFITSKAANFSMLDLGVSIDRLVTEISKSNSV